MFIFITGHRLPDAVEKELNLTFHESVESSKVCDVVVLSTQKPNIFLMRMINKMKKGAYIVNC